MKPTNSKVPKSIGIVLDGNRRFAKKIMLKPWKGHEWGYEKIKKLLDWSKELGIKEITLYCFSIENFNRPKKEFDYLMDLFQKAFIETKKDPRIKDTRINFIGRIYMFPPAVQKAILELVEQTKNNSPYQVNFAMAYGGRTEIVDATKAIAQQIKEGTLDINEINEKVFSKNLYFEHEPELIIRTGGEKRTSNFLNFQSAYSEWIFLEKTWPEFEKEDLVECIKEYGRRERRFGR